MRAVLLLSTAVVALLLLLLAPSAADANTAKRLKQQVLGAAAARVLGDADFQEHDAKTGPTPKPKSTKAAPLTAADKKEIAKINAAMARLKVVPIPIPQAKVPKQARFMQVQGTMGVDMGTDRMQVIVLNVGNADSIFVRTDNGMTVLVDAGSSKVRDMLVDGLGVEQLDAFVLTHAHHDHYRGAKKILAGSKTAAAIPVKRFVYGTASDHDHAAKLDEIAGKAPASTKIRKQAHDKVYTLEKGGFVMNVFSAPVIAKSNTNENFHSLLVIIEYAGKTVMLTGDAQTELQDEWAKWRRKRYIPDSIDFYKAAHHGASNGISHSWWGYTSGTGACTHKAAVIAVSTSGKHRGHRHPREDAMTVYNNCKTGILARTNGKRTALFSKEIGLQHDSSNGAAVLWRVKQDGGVAGAFLPELTDAEVVIDQEGDDPDGTLD